MKFRYYLLFLNIILLIQSCKYKQKIKIEDTIWVYSNDSNNSVLKDTFKFKINNECEYYSSEILYHFNGKFSILNDTIKLKLIDDQSCEDGAKISKFEFNLYIENQKLFDLFPIDIKPNKVYLRKL